MKVYGIHMKRYITNYLNEMNALLMKPIENVDEVLQKHLIKIQFFQHERMIHLLVTMTAVLLDILGFYFAITFENISILLICVLLMFFVIPYILHYFLLENCVQQMYLQYDKLLEMKKSLVHRTK